MTAPALSMKELRRVVIAAAVGNVIEWYDFYIFGSLAALLSVKFFEQGPGGGALIRTVGTFTAGFLIRPLRSEEHTSELQSQSNLVCRLLLEKKNNPLSVLSRSPTPLPQIRSL